MAKDVVTPDRWWSNKRSWTQVEKEGGGGKGGGKRHSNSIPIAWPSHAEGPDARPANQGTKGDKAHKGHDPFSLVLSRSGDSVVPADYQAGLRKGRSLGVWLALAAVFVFLFGDEFLRCYLSALV